MKERNGNLESATGHLAPIVGETTLPVGALKVPALLCPSIGDALVSGGQLIKEGYTAVL
jgi:hypothetical protein